jgi:D-hydroxyproline dehydrogenase subunit gamma
MSDPRPSALRIAGATRGAMVSLVVDGEPIPAFLGESVATALLAAGQRALRASPRNCRPRGMFCAMGVCQECVVQIDGRTQTSCTTPVRNGMRVSTGTPNEG